MYALVNSVRSIIKKSKVKKSLIKKLKSVGMTLKN